MFIGHFAVGFASRRAAPRTSMLLLMSAPLLADLMWPILLLLGVESVRITPNSNPFLSLTFDSYPVSHSLAMSLLWSALFGIMYWNATRDGRGGVVLGIGVLSHWVLDFLTHVPDLPLFPGGPRVGLGLWNSVAGTIVVESAMFVAGFAIYLRATRARDRIGLIAPWALFLVLAALYVMNLTSPPPPSPEAIGWVGLVGALFPLWAWWADRHREVVARARTA